ncbi:MAG: SIMPL domain-containing protein [Caldilineaceae bacterium]|nr:SIMPL domain-containing protein [Caldilineaceae bacterium]
MNKQALRIVVPVLSSALILGSVLIGGAAGWLNVPVVEAQTPPQPQIATALPGTITVVGEGKVTLEPDIARVTIGVETVTNTVKEASDQNRATVEAVLAALGEQGIAKEDMQTSGFSIFAERFGPEGPLAEGDVRYRVSNNVMVTIRQLDAVGTVLDAAIDAGANNIYGVEFALDDPGESESEARQAAIADAQEKAADLAELTGLTLGQVVSVSEVVGAGGGYYAGNFAEQARAFGGGGTPITPGQLDLVMQLQVIFTISGATE